MIGFVVLLVGIALWAGAHMFRRLAPEARARMGDPTDPKDKSKGLFAILIVLSIVIMVYGYRWAEFIYVWQPPAFFTHINNLLMLLAFYTFGASAAKPAKVWLGTKIRHPQLVAFKLWAVAHLLVNGDLASILLFGLLLLWAGAEVALINRAEGPWTPPQRAPVRKEIVLVVITLVLFVVVALIHNWLGVYPFGG